MGMLDCPKCWDLWCECGEQYKGWGNDQRAAVAAAMTGLPKSFIEQAMEKKEQIKTGDVTLMEHWD